MNEKIRGATLAIIVLFVISALSAAVNVKTCSMGERRVSKMPISAVKNEVINLENSEVKTNVFTTTLNSRYIGGDEEDPEIVDEANDTLFDYVDILSAWFYEDPDEPGYLYTALKIANLKDKRGTVYAIHWYCDGVHYDTGLHNGILIPKIEGMSWSCAYYERHPIWFWRWIPADTWNDSYNSGYFDLENNIITWKIHKSCVGNPQPGDVLTKSYVFTAQRISKIGLIPFGPLFRSFSDGTSYLDSKDYIIQY